MTKMNQILRKDALATVAFAIFAFLVTLCPAHASTVSIHDIQYTTSSGGASPYVGQEVTITGTVTSTHYYGYFVAEAPGPWSAISVYSFTESPAVGDQVRLTGYVNEYYGMTQITYLSSFDRLSSGNPVEATPVQVADVSQEQYESVLVTVKEVTVAALLNYGEWAVMDDSYNFALCNDMNDYMYFPKLEDKLDSVTGVLSYNYGEFKIEPRSTDDIAETTKLHYALHGNVVTMNDARDVLFGAYVEILDDEIVAIHTDPPGDIQVIKTSGLIFPGLIDSHNHPSYNVLDVIPFETQFEDRYEWRDAPVYDDFGDQLSSIRHYGGYGAQSANLWKLAEVRALTAGTTSIQGSNCSGENDNYFAHPGIGTDNVERFPVRVYHDTFPFWRTYDFWAGMNGEYWDRFIIHLAEGINADALSEFYIWQGAGMLDERTTIIHGVPLGAPEWSAMAAVGANLIWSPQSNLVLYGQTADIPGALAAGVNVALGPDWTESGSRHLLDEIKAADAYDNEHWRDAISPLQFAEFVTRNAAKAVGSEHLIGQIAPGYRANLMVIPGFAGAPYQSLMLAEPKWVKLTVVGGRPMYGDPELMSKFGFLEGLEPVLIDGWKKMLAVQVDAQTIPEANKPFAQVMSELQAAYDASYPKVCEFAGLD